MSDSDSTASDNQSVKKLDFPEFLELAIFEPIKSFFGLGAVIDAWGTNEDRANPIADLDPFRHSECRSEEERANKIKIARIYQKVPSAFLVVLALVNSFDMILDLYTNASALVTTNECDDSSWETLLLSVMTLLAGHVRNVNEQVERVYHNPKNVDQRVAKYIYMEMVVFTIEDGASIFILATRPCPLNTAEWVSTFLTLLSFVPIAVTMFLWVYLILKRLYESVSKPYFKAAVAFASIALSGVALFVAFFSYQFVIVSIIFNDYLNSSASPTSSESPSGIFHASSAPSNSCELDECGTEF